MLNLRGDLSDLFRQTFTGACEAPVPSLIGADNSRPLRWRFSQMWVASLVGGAALRSLTARVLPLNTAPL